MSDQRLSGVRVLVTRPRERAQELCFLLEDEGSEVIALPLLELLPPEDPRPLRAAAERIQRYAWVVFTSPSGVQALVEAVREAGAMEYLYRPHIAAVGPRTAQAVREYGLSVIVQAEVSTGTGLFDALKLHLKEGDQILLPAAQDGRRELGNALDAYGGEDESVEICHRLARDRAGLKRLGADLYAEFLQLQPTDEPAFIRDIRELLLRAWAERCRGTGGQAAASASPQER